jgi:hypothetical protein
MGPVAYVPLRPSELDGVAPLTVYRAVNGWNPPTPQEPMFFTRLQWAFNRLLSDPDPDLAALMHGGQQHGDIPKLWAEAAVEHKRQEIAPDKVSRLDALYACFDPLEAFLMVDSGVAVSSVWKGELSDGVRWSATDFLAFKVIRPPVGATGQAFADAWTQLLGHADAYWKPSQASAQLEVLVEGEIELSERLVLREILEGQGFVMPAPAPPVVAPAVGSA